jgi:hypothetical protein
VRVWVGVDVELRSESHDGVHLQGRTRLAPGRVIEIAHWQPPSPAVIRRALVRTWLVQQLGSEGPVYHGFCAWQ